MTRRSPSEAEVDAFLDLLLARAAQPAREAALVLVSRAKIALINEAPRTAADLLTRAGLALLPAAPGAAEIGGTGGAA